MKYIVYLLRILCILLFLVCYETFAYTPIPGSPLAANSHPRIFINPTTLATVAAKATGSHSRMYATLKSRANTLLKTDPKSGSYSVTIFNRMAVLSLVALIEKTNGNSYSVYRDRAFFYAEYILTNTDPWNLTSKYVGGSYHIRGQTGALSLVYDWLYSDLTPLLKRDIHTFLINVYKGLHNIDRPLGTGQVRKSAYGSNYWLEWGAQPWFSVALYGDGEGDEAIINDALDATKNEVDNYMVKALNMLGGALHNGWGYQLGDGDTSFCLLNLWAWETATGEKVFTSSFSLKDYPQYFLYASKPDGALIKINDTNDNYANPTYPYGTLKWGVADARSFLIVLMDIYKDGHAKYIVDKNDFRPGGDRMWRNLIFYDDSVIEKLPSTLPLATFFPQTGILLGRSGWKSDALYYTFRNRDQYGSHSDSKQNSFTIYNKKAPLAINDGNYPAGASGKQSTKSYYRKTISCNSMLVYDPSETFYNFAVVYNDGGQKFGTYYADKGTGGYSPYYNADLYDQTAFDGSDWNTADNTFEDGTGYTYIKGDATRGYTSKVSHFTREFVNLKPNLFVIYDRLTSSNASFRKSFLLHSLTEPQLNGTEDFTCAESFATSGERACQGDTNAGISKSYDSGLVTITNGKGKLFSKILLPNNRYIRKIGGPGYRFWVDGANANIPPVGYTKSVTGGWRLEMSPGAPALSDDFLHVLYATDSATGSMPDTVTIKNSEGNMPSNNMVGVLVKNSMENKIALFSSDTSAATVTNDINYTVDTSTASRHILFNLQTNTLYSVNISGIGTSQVQSSGNGTLIFVNSSAGSYNYAIFASGTAGVYPSRSTVMRGAQSGNTSYSAGAKNILVTKREPSHFQK